MLIIFSGILYFRISVKVDLLCRLMKVCKELHIIIVVSYLRASINEILCNRLEQQAVGERVLGCGTVILLGESQQRGVNHLHIFHREHLNQHRNQHRVHSTAEGMSHISHCLNQEQSD